MNENENNTQKNSIIAKLSVPYNDSTVLTTNSQELELVNYYFDSISSHNKEVETLLYEVIGYSLTKTSKLNKAFILKGNGRNGKSKIFRILEALLGEEQCSHEHLENISGCKAGSKTTVLRLNGCTVNIAEDQKQPKYINTSLITRIISGEPIVVEQKGTINLVPYATMLFSVNEVIDFKETGIYITDRFIVIPFNATFTDSSNNRDINIGENLCKPLALQIIATRALKAFSEVLKKGRFTIPSIVEEETKKYFLECNNVVEFCELYPIKDVIRKEAYFKEYCKWCNYNNIEAVNNVKFGKEVLALGYRSERYGSKDQRKTYYTAPDFDKEKFNILYDNFLKKVCLTKETVENYNENELRTSKGTNFSDFLVKNLYSNQNN